MQKCKKVIISLLITTMLFSNASPSMVIAAENNEAELSLSQNSLTTETSESTEEDPIDAEAVIPPVEDVTVSSNSVDPDPNPEDTEADEASNHDVGEITAETVSTMAEPEAENESEIIPVEDLFTFHETQSQYALMSLPNTTCPTYQEAYERITALQDTYPEGMTWTNFTPYSVSNSYDWRGGRLKIGDRYVNGGAGCVALGFGSSDHVFGDLPGRAINAGDFTFDDIKIGDLLWITNSHMVVVWQKSESGIIVVEGNYNGTVHWGRACSKAEVMNSIMLITRYPENFVPADDPEADSEVGSGDVDGLHWSVTKSGVLTIAGSGAIPNYSLNNLAPWSQSSYNTIVIDGNIGNIGDYAFYQSKALNVYLPDSIANIGQSAFAESQLIAITIPHGTTTIQNSAFRNCKNLTSVSIPEGLKTIGDNAFRGCTSLTYADFPSSITSIGAGAFMSCEVMTRIRFVPSNQNVTIGDNLFSQCWRLSDVTLPKSAARISSGMFASCSSLPTLYIPASVQEIGENPFTSCNFLGTIYFGGSEADWKKISNPYLEASLKSTGTTVIFDTKFDDPFAKDPNDPQDPFTDNGGNPGDNEEQPGGPDDGDQPPDEPEEPEEPGDDQPPQPEKPDQPGDDPEHGCPGGVYIPPMPKPPVMIVEDSTSQYHNYSEPQATQSDDTVPNPTPQSDDNPPELPSIDHTERHSEAPSVSTTTHTKSVASHNPGQPENDETPDSDEVMTDDSARSEITISQAAESELVLQPTPTDQAGETDESQEQSRVMTIIIYTLGLCLIACCGVIYFIKHAPIELKSKWFPKRK